MAKRDPGEWQGGGTILPQRIVLDEFQKETVKADLWSLGITDDIFAMSPSDRIKFLSRQRKIAVAVYAAIKHATDGGYTLTQSFHDWSRGLGLPW